MSAFIFRLESLFTSHIALNRNLLNHFRSDYNVLFGGISNSKGLQLNRMLDLLYRNQIQLDSFHMQGSNLVDMSLKTLGQKKTFVFSDQDEDFIKGCISVRISSANTSTFKTDYTLNHLDELESIFFDLKNK